MITFANIAIGTGGNVACTRCFPVSSRPAVAPYEVAQVTREIAATMRSWRAGPGPNVTLCGFEPFSHPGLPEIIAAGVTQGVQRVRLRTDGGALSVSGNAFGVLQAGVTQLEIVMLAAGEEHDSLVGRDGLCAACEAGVRAFTGAAADTGVPVAVTGLVPVCRHNAGRAADTVARLASLGFVAVHLDARACRDSDWPLVLAALDTAAVNGVAGSVSGGPIKPPAPWDRRPWSEAGEVAS